MSGQISQKLHVRAHQHCVEALRGEGSCITYVVLECMASAERAPKRCSILLQLPMTRDVQDYGRSHPLLRIVGSEYQIADVCEDKLVYQRRCGVFTTFGARHSHNSTAAHTVLLKTCSKSEGHILSGDSGQWISSVGRQHGYNQSLACRKLALNDALHALDHCPDLHNLQAALVLQKLGPLFFRTLFRSKTPHHDEVKGCLLGILLNRRDHVLMDQELAVAWTHGVLDRLDNLDAVCIWPIVENEVSVVGTCSCERMVSVMKTAIRAQRLMKSLAYP
jgi:hypothetical protein